MASMRWAPRRCSADNTPNVSDGHSLGCLRGSDRFRRLPARTSRARGLSSSSGPIRRAATDGDCFVAIGVTRPLGADVIAFAHEQSRREGQRRRPPLVVGVADASNYGPHGTVLERRPARDGGGRLAAYQAAADQPDADGPGYRTASDSSMPSARSTPTSLWTIAISARVIPRGEACWMMFRPYTIPAAP
jgi:hypothetical protein